MSKQVKLNTLVLARNGNVPNFNVIFLKYGQVRARRYLKRKPQYNVYWLDEDFERV